MGETNWAGRTIHKTRAAQHAPEMRVIMITYNVTTGRFDIGSMDDLTGWMITVEAKVPGVGTHVTAIRDDYRIVGIVPDKPIVRVGDLVTTRVDGKPYFRAGETAKVMEVMSSGDVIGDFNNRGNSIYGTGIWMIGAGKYDKVVP